MSEDNTTPPGDGSRLLKAVEAIAITPSDAEMLVNQYWIQSKKKHPNDRYNDHQERVAKKIVKRYARLSALVGGGTALAGVVPGIGTAVALFGGAATDVAIGMKLQVDMCMCLAENFGYDLTSEDAKHLSFLIAAGGALEQAGSEGAIRVGSKAGVKLLKEHLKGATLVAVKEAFKKVGVTFTRKSLEKAIPFGIGVAIGGSANYGLTRYVGREATTWFVIDRDS
jgi:uncharacterized protein (DUF697 family)